MGAPDEKVPEPAGERSGRPWLGGWEAGSAWTFALLLLLLALDAWAMTATDPDYFLPDLVRPISIGLVVVFLATGWLRAARARSAFRGLFLLLAAVVLLLEARYRFREGGAQRVVPSGDALLRYHYRPGHVEVLPSGGSVRVNHSGLLDVEHPLPKPPGLLRVAVLTGSIANDAGIPFEDRFFRRLQHELEAARPGGAIDVMNVSCEGYNTVQQVRLLEKVGLEYQPDVVVVAYMLSAAAIQNGGYRRFGNSFFAFRFLPLFESLESGSACAVFRPFHERYSFDLVVRSSFERLGLLSKIHGFRPLVAVLPVVEDANDAVCAPIYDQVVRVAREAGLPAVRVADAFRGLSRQDLAKPGRQDDVCHPNAEGHHRIARAIADALAPLLPPASP